MTWIVANMKWIMLVSGALTSTMLYALIAPEAALRATFGDSVGGPVADIVVRNWGALIGLMGGMLLYGAFDPSVRPLVLTIAGLSKLTFLTLLMVFGRPFLSQAVVPIVSDVIQVGLFLGYLIAVRRMRQEVA